jgi:glucokinase
MDLIADIGATNTRCALVDDKGRVLSPEKFENADFTGIEPLLRAYLDNRRASDRPRRAALAIAAPIQGDDVRMLNIDWGISQTALKENLGLSRLIVVNDFVAVAWSLPTLGPDGRRQIGGGAAATGAALATLGPGSGLGVASLVPATDGWTAVSSEGGHVTMAAATPEEAELVEQTRKLTGHCSAERLLSGPGLERLYTLLSERAGRGTPTITAPDVAGLARQREPLARKTVDIFFAFLGTAAANLALTVGARGGVYIAGGIVPKLGDLIDSSPFRSRFVDMGRYRDYMEAIPTFVITEVHPAFRGLRSLLGYR